MKLAPWFVLAIAALGAGTNAGCSDQNSCGLGASAGSGGSCNESGASAGSAGTATTTCSYLTALQACLAAFCQADGAGTPYCNCFTRGFDLSAADGTSTACQCVSAEASAASICQTYAGVDGSKVDCAVASSLIATQCVGVQ